MRLPSLLAALLMGTSLFAPARAAGTIDVVFAEPGRFVDAGRGEAEVERTLRAMEAAFQALSRRLPEGHHLAVRVTELDLAGEIKPARMGRELRVLTGRADWPRMTLSYTLSESGRTLKSGESKIADMSYLQRPLGNRQDQPFAYEERMIERWFVDTFEATATPATAPTRGTP